MILFTEQQLGNWLMYPSGANAARTLLVEQVVTGWLLDTTELDALPDPLPPQLFAWALELGGIAYENPTTMTTDQTVDQTSSWATTRRGEILDAARAWARRQPDNPTSGSAAGALPSGEFPPPQCYPDRSRAGWRGLPVQWYGW